MEFITNIGVTMGNQGQYHPDSPADKKVNLSNFDQHRKLLDVIQQTNKHSQITTRHLCPKKPAISICGLMKWCCMNLSKLKDHQW